MVQQSRYDSVFNDFRTVPRRGMLGSLAALSIAGAFVPLATADAEEVTDTAAARWIDVHHHFFPPAWLQHAEQQKPGPSPIMRDWSEGLVLEHMDKTGVATAIASLSPWGVTFADSAQLPMLARACNDYAAQMMDDHAGRFGLFAAMPLPDVDASLKEIAYALDELKADGIGLMTSYGDKWPGDPLFRPVFEELDRRKAVAYFHPTTPNCCGNLIPGAPAGPATIEWPVDTARAILSLLTSGSLIRYRTYALSSRTPAARCRRCPAASPTAAGGSTRRTTAIAVGSWACPRYRPRRNSAARSPPRPAPADASAHNTPSPQSRRHGPATLRAQAPGRDRRAWRFVR